MFAKKIALLTLACAFCLISQAYAHRLNVFAWLNNDKIVVQCNFGSRRPAQNGNVKVMDSVTHKELLTGQTNASGEFVFPAPEVVREGHGLIIQVDAGQGHMGEWKMEPSELYAAASLAAGLEAARLQTNGQDGPEAEPAQINLPTSGDISDARLRSIIAESLAPINESLAKLSNREPGVAEIIGGLGWIMGLAGIALYFLSRRKK